MEWAQASCCLTASSGGCQRPSVPGPLSAGPGDRQWHQGLIRSQRFQWGSGDLGGGSLVSRTRAIRQCSRSTEAQWLQGQPPKRDGAAQMLHKGLSRKMQPCLDSLNAFSLKRRFPRPFFPPKTAFPPSDKTKLHQNCCELSARCLPCLGRAALCRPSKPTPLVRAEFPLPGHDQPLAVPQTPCSVADPPSSWSQPRCRLHPTAPAEAAEPRKQKQNKKKAMQPPDKATSLGAAREIIPHGFPPPPPLIYCLMGCNPSTAGCCSNSH